MLGNSSYITITWKNTHWRRHTYTSLIWVAQHSSSITSVLRDNNQFPTDIKTICKSGMPELISQPGWIENVRNFFQCHIRTNGHIKIYSLRHCRNNHIHTHLHIWSNSNGFTFQMKSVGYSKEAHIYNFEQQQRYLHKLYAGMLSICMCMGVCACDRVM